MQEDKKSALERLEKNLYSRTDPGLPRRHVLHSSAPEEVDNGWQNDERPFTMPVEERKKFPLHTKILITSGIFFLITLGVAAYSFFGGSQTVSVDNIGITISGPVSVAAGDTLGLSVSVENKNSVAIESVNMTSEFPKGSRDPNDPTVDLSRSTDVLGIISAGNVLNREVRAVVFGGENDIKTVKVSIEYRTAGSNAIFHKEKTYEVNISTSPVTVAVSGLKKINSGKEIELSVVVASNSTSIIKNLALSVDYPFGFMFRGATPSPSAGNNLFSVGDLAPGAKRTFTMRGTVNGEDGETRVFTARAGIRGAETDTDLATTIVSQIHEIAIERPFIGLDMALDSISTGDISVQPGRPVRVDITWTNNLPTRVTNASIVVQLSGNSIDKNSVSVSKGFYNSLENSISWDARQMPELSTLAPGATGRVSFSVTSLRREPGAAASNSSISIITSAKGTRVDEDGGAGDNVATSLSRTIRVNTNPSVIAQTLYSTGSIKNTGLIPPKAEKETTYTIVWTVLNPSNSMSGAVVAAKLPSYVSWKNVTANNQNITYNSIGGIVTWNIGDIAAGSGYDGKTPVTVSFQVGLIPSVSQVGMSPELVSQPEFTAIDDFTGSPVAVHGDMSTIKLNDGSYQGGIVTN